MECILPLGLAADAGEILWLAWVWVMRIMFNGCTSTFGGAASEQTKYHGIIRMGERNVNCDKSTDGETGGRAGCHEMIGIDDQSENGRSPAIKAREWGVF